MLAKLNEFCAVDLRLLEFAQQLLVSFFDFGLALVPARFCLPNRVVGFGKSLAELFAECLQFPAQRSKDSLDFGKDVGVRQPLQGLAGNERCVYGQSFGEFIVERTVLVKSFVQVGEQPLLTNQQALFLQPFFEPGLLEPLLRLFETRQGRKLLVKTVHLTAHIDDPAARALQFQTHLRFPSRKGGVPGNEALQQERKFFGTFGKFGNFVLPEDFHPWYHVMRRQGQDCPRLILHDGRIRHRSFDRVATLGRLVRSYKQRDLCAGLQHMADHTFMGLPRFLAEWIETERITYAFDYRRFAGAPSAYQHVQVFIEVHGGIAQEPAFPSHREELGMGIGLQIAVQTDPGVRVEKRLPERLDRDGRHLDEAGGSVLLQALRVVDVRSVQNRKGAVALVLGILVFEDWPDPFRRVTDWTRQSAGKQIGIGPDIDSRLPRELSEQSAFGGYMGSDAHRAPGLRAFK